MHLAYIVQVDQTVHFKIILYYHHSQRSDNGGLQAARPRSERPPHSLVYLRYIISLKGIWSIDYKYLTVAAQ